MIYLKNSGDWEYPTQCDLSNICERHNKKKVTGKYCKRGIKSAYDRTIVFKTENSSFE